MSQNLKYFSPSNLPSYGAPTCYTEPMNLASSPVNSPPQNCASGGTHYLPGFLMSDNLQPNLSTKSPSPLSESKPSGQTAYVSPPGPTALQHMTPHTHYLSQQHEPISRRLTSPPTQTIWSSVGGGNLSTRPKQPESFGGIKHSTPNAAIGPGASVANKRLGSGVFISPAPASNRTPLHNIVNQSAQVPNSPVCNSSFINNNNNNGQSSRGNLLTPDRLAEILVTNNSCNETDCSGAQECWVTVFGFPSARSAFILNQFAQFGTIEKHLITNNGNWMHIKYQNKMQARCALNKNGKVFGDNIMVGVSNCTDPQIYMGVTVGQQSNRSVYTPIVLGKDHSFLSPKPSNQKLNNSINTEFKSNGLRSMDSPNPCNLSTIDKPICNVGRHNSMRSLAASNRPGNLSRTSSVRHNPDSGLLSKALGYMFGWS